MLDIGTRVKHLGHGLGTIVGYNTANSLGHLLKLLQDPAYNDDAAIDALIAGSEGLLYDKTAFPFVVEFDSGYRDVYDLDGTCLTLAE